MTDILDILEKLRDTAATTAILGMDVAANPMDPRAELVLRSLERRRASLDRQLATAAGRARVHVASATEAVIELEDGSRWRISHLEPNDAW